MERYILNFRGLFLAFVALMSGGMSFAQRAELQLPPGQKAILDYPDYDAFRVELRGDSREELNIKVLRKEDDSFISGFGLAAGGQATLTVVPGGYLLVGNSSSRSASIRIDVSPVLEQEARQPGDNKAISFTLYNSSLKSVPLIIPNVMNPNLSPKSSSGVSLEPGQEIYFRIKGKKYLLFAVDESIAEGERIDIPALIRERKKELGL